MFTKLTLSMAKIIELRTNPIVKVITASGTTSDSSSKDDLIGQEKIKSLSQVARAMDQILRKIVGPILSAIGIAAVLYAIYLGVQFAKAESAEKRKDIQGRLIGACIGAVIIIVAATLCFALKWAEIYFSFTGEKHGYDSKDGDNYCDWCGGLQDNGIHK